MQSAFYTIGHSTHSVPEIVELLRQAGATLVADVRSIPRSRTNPQFNSDTFPRALADFGIGYRHIRELGGLRARPRGGAVSPNAFWQNASFRNYADYAATPPFQAGLDDLRRLAQADVCAIMCAEAVWWRCHRRIIADYLLMAGETVWHIMAPFRLETAHLTPAAVATDEGTLVYPGCASQARSGERSPRRVSCGIRHAGGPRYGRAHPPRHPGDRGNHPAGILNGARAPGRLAGRRGRWSGNRADRRQRVAVANV